GGADDDDLARPVHQVVVADAAVVGRDALEPGDQAAVGGLPQPAVVGPRGELVLVAVDDVVLDVLGAPRRPVGRHEDAGGAHSTPPAGVISDHGHRSAITRSASMPCQREVLMVGKAPLYQAIRA